MSEVKIDRLTIHDASTAEIRKFGYEECGLEFNEDAGREFMVHAIYEAMEWDAYEPSEDATHVIVRLPITADQKTPYRGGFNGRMFSIKRGVDTKIPVEFYNTIVDSASAGFTLSALAKDGTIDKDNSEVRKPIPLDALDIRVVSWINEGTEKPLPPSEKKEVIRRDD